MANRERKNKIMGPAGAFGIPVLLFALFCCLKAVTPFGDSTLLSVDMGKQYIHFYAYLKSVLFGGNDLFYSLSMGIGSDFVGLAAYYLLSPFTLFFVFTPEQLFPDMLTLVTALKIGTCGLTAYLFLTRRSEPLKDALIFSTAYALCAYVFLYCSNLMWMDGVYILPLIALGIENLLNGRGPVLYILSLAYGIVTNYYIGYMLCIFSVIWFAYLYLLKLTGPRMEPLTFRSVAREILRYAAASLPSC